MKRFLILLLLWCGAAIAQPGHTFFIAKIKNHTRDTLTIATMQFSHASSYFADSTGTFVCGELDVQTGIFMLFYNNRQLPVFIKNGTTVTLKADEKNFLETLAFEGDTEKENNCMAQCLRDKEKLRLQLNSAGLDVKALKKLNYDNWQQAQRHLRDKKLDLSFRTTMEALAKMEYDMAATRIAEIETSQKLKGKPCPGFEFENYNGGMSKLEDFKGKYIFIDIWFTIAEPARYQDSMIQLQERYKDKNIAFVSISVDGNKNRDRWLNYVPYLEGRTHLLAGKALKSRFAKEIELTTIPRFIIVDPEGKIVDANAPRPFEPKLRQLLDSLLTQ